MINNTISSRLANQTDNVYYIPKDEIERDLRKAVSKQTFSSIRNKNLTSEQLFFFHEFIKTDEWKNADIMAFNKAKRSENKTLLLNSFDSPNIIGGVINSRIMINIDSLY